MNLCMILSLADFCTNNITIHTDDLPTAILILINSVTYQSVITKRI